MKIYFELSFNPSSEISSDPDIWLVIHRKNAAERRVRMLRSANPSYHANIDFSDISSLYFHYHYSMEREKGLLIPEENNQRDFHWKKGMNHIFYLKDEWNDSSSNQNVLLKSPFLNAFFRQKKERSFAREEKNKIEFLVYAPGLDKNKKVCLLGNKNALGQWNTGKPVIMQKTDDKWMAQTNIEGHEGENVEYKYGLYDVKEKRFLYYEEGDNRCFSLYKKEKNTQTIISDNFFRFPDKPWTGGGVAVPVFSLRSKEGLGIGEFTDIKLLADWAEKTGLKILQLLPVNDTTATHTWKDSYPYAAISAFALHPIYINLKKIGSLASSHPLEKKYNPIKDTLNLLPELDYEKVLNYKWEYLKALYKQKKKDFLEDKKFKSFFKQHQNWLKPYAVFCYLRDQYKTADYSAFEGLKLYDIDKINEFLSSGRYDPEEVGIHYFIQFHLHLQLSESIQYAHKKGIAIKGDIPIGIYRHSADAWIHTDQFFLNMQAGAPPDSFAVKGQNWGFPTYNWSVMESDNFSWWRKRLQHLSLYFDAIRFDHILGFFRIWQIPIDQLEGIMGFFYPSKPFSAAEIKQRGILFDESTFCQPLITLDILQQYLDGDAQEVIRIFLEKTEHDKLVFKPDFDTQRKIEEFFNGRDRHGESYPGYWKQCLFDLVSNVLFFRANEEKAFFYPRFGMMKTSVFFSLPKDQQDKLLQLHNDYFYNRHDRLWQREAFKKLPALKTSTAMLVCGEDLGMMANSVPETLHQLGILGMEVQRMPKKFGIEFTNLQDVPYLSVVTTSTHDTSTLRSWWEEDRGKTQRYFNQMMHHYGTAPYFCEPWVVKEILMQHFQSPAMLVIIPIQDLLGLSGSLRRENPHDERINVPADPCRYWRFRIHLNLEELIENNDLNSIIRGLVVSSGRCK